MSKIKAIVYDYDGTLTPDSYPVFAIVEESGVKGGCGSLEFQKQVHDLAKRDNISPTVAFINIILDTVKAAGYDLTDENITLGADQREYHSGVEEFLQKVQALGADNYLLSSGSKAYLERTTIAPYFTGIYGSTLSYDVNSEAVGIDHAMTTEAKVDSLRQIAQSINGLPEDCTGLVYVGDGPTDVPVMDYVKNHGGVTVLVQDPTTQADVERQLQELAAGTPIKEAITYRFPADFSVDSELSQFIMAQI